ncbi:glycosyltransferase family 87 protein [Terrabacter sp. 2YAF2]|uniref:glycosyltransferase family 87 protein n=1 Tax=Terrabacter sp. 2YAF2 TaxID=3233026 RepID=UPI003F9802F1
MSVSYYVARDRLGGDAHAYWLTGQSWYVAYEIAPNHNDAFLYSPAFAQLIRPLTWLPWPAFLTLWVTAETAAFGWLLRPLGWRWALPLILWCAPEIVIGNVLGFLGVALVASFARPWMWSAMVLTKPIFGLGSLWFAARRQWRQFAGSMGATALIVAISTVLNPTAWAHWLLFLATNAGGSATTLILRSALAVTVVVIAARKGQRWPVAVALLLATPVFAGAPSLTILAAIPRLMWNTEPDNRQDVSGAAEVVRVSTG